MVNRWFSFSVGLRKFSFVCAPIDTPRRVLSIVWKVRKKFVFFPNRPSSVPPCPSPPHPAVPPRAAPSRPVPSRVRYVRTLGSKARNKHLWKLVHARSKSISPEYAVKMKIDSAKMMLNPTKSDWFLKNGTCFKPPRVDSVKWKADSYLLLSPDIVGMNKFLWNLSIASFSDLICRTRNADIPQARRSGTERDEAGRSGTERDRAGRGGTNEPDGRGSAPKVCCLFVEF